MAWQNLTLNQFLGSIVSEVNQKIDQLQEEADKILVYKAKVEEKLSQLNAFLTEVEDLAQRLEVSGFYSIKLAPAQGSWSDRLANADNHPPLSPEFYTAGMACILIAPGLDALEEAYGNLKEAFTKKIEMPKVQPQPPSFNPYIFKTEEPVEDVWKSLALKDIFPGMAKSVEEKLNKVKAEVKKVQGILDQLEEKYNKIMQSIDEAQQFLNNLTNTGVYSLILEPAKGGWLARMTSEDGAPPDSSAYYTAGIVTVVCVPTLDECKTLFEKLITFV